MDQNLVLGIEFIDRQHDELFRRMDLLLETCMNRSCSAEAAGMIAYLDDYVVTHFTAEEGLQKALAYPDFEHHRLMHATFSKNIGFIKSEIAGKGLTDSVIQHVSQMLIEWFGQHIMEQDRAMSDFLKGSAAMD